MEKQIANPLRILIADGHPMCVEGVRAVLRNVDGMEIIQEATTGSDALRLIIERKPDIAILDITMPGMHGLAVLKQILAEAPTTRVVIFSAYEDSAYARDTISAGAHGYVLKRSTSQCLLQAIDAVRRGGLYLDPAIAAHLVSGNAGTTRRASGRGGRIVVTLTEREREVFKLIAFGFTNKEVAGKLGVTSKSIETYKTRASEKLDIRSRAKIVQYAILQGWFSAPSS
ncbi:response regulator transcription factor [Methylobacterium sp. BTF04]|uniref:response regulator n=1 Tax=Methylobacterium sp. BTF04 TaxID=2708300 RepID=UPI0013D60DEE|nr:response regulator transcription factor [Methylobacterium sp. BTF04]NEU14280.1 response regulator transcription factor [Methylobacterium sp. BTF04]